MYKYCPICKTLSTTSNFCAWCGEDMKKYIEYPEFNSWDERLKIYEQMKADARIGSNIREDYKPKINQQLSLFS